MNTYSNTIDQIQVDLIESSQKNAPTVVLIMGIDEHESVLSRARKQQCPSFHLVSLSHFNWDQDLSPWPSKSIIYPNDDFAGKANQFLKTIETKIKDWVDSLLPVEAGPWIIAGYSMGGLFAMYCPYRSSLFTNVCCVSGSVWYPGFESFATTETMIKKPKSVYFSLGRKEIQERNPYLQTTGKIMESLEEDYKKKGIKTTMVWNNGNHFTDPVGRMVDALIWTLHQK
ncbi:alpha/beta hydrolase-fold protein [Dubosiella newyorkensis]|uniref:Esterase n=2 Tax=Dubosiella newyorkensis TaxID=1862672 RepID=A0A1U7NMH3_9FIRM|nr:alpha/beta hydrolase-fold protein [Dubosiella newyorkensis]OLU46360.1 hypothetical protein BO225_06225 [Dubosiella newyorkensis]